jgi:hypothetical protein
MNLREKLLLDRITDPRELSEAEQQELRADSGLAAIISHNRALAEDGSAPAAPMRQAMLASVYSSAERLRPEEHREIHMNWFSRITSGQSLPVKFALGFAAVACFALLTVFFALVRPEGPSLAATNGYVLKFSGDLTMGDDELKRLADEVQAEVKRIKEEYAKTDPSVLEKKNVVMRIEARKDSDTGPLKFEIVLGLIGENEGLLKALQEGLSGVAGLGTPEVVPNTWFSPDGADLSGSGINIGLNLDGQDRQFTFPEGASEEEIEETLRGWIAEQHPGTDCTVDVTIKRDGDHVQVGVEVKCPEEGHGAEAAAGV